MIDTSLLIFKNSLTKYESKKTIYFHFNKIFGLGSFRIKFLLSLLGLNKLFFGETLQIVNASIYLRLQLIFELSNWLLQENLKNRRFLNFSLQKKLKNYKFLRKKYGLSVNGQRTHSNCQSIKRIFFMKKSIILKKKVKKNVT